MQRTPQQKLVQICYLSSWFFPPHNQCNSIKSRNAKKQQSKSWEKFTHTVTKEMFFCNSTALWWGKILLCVSKSAWDWFSLQPIVERSALSVLCVLGRQLDILLSSPGSNCRQLGSCLRCSVPCQSLLWTLTHLSCDSYWVLACRNESTSVYIPIKRCLLLTTW